MRFLPLFLIVFSGLGLTQSGDGFAPTNDEELALSQNYLHNGQSARMEEELCQDSKYDDLCSNQSTAFRSESLQQLEGMMPIVSNVFATVVNAGNLVGGQGAAQPSIDYCGMIAGGVEAGARMMVQMQGQKIQSNLENSDKMSRQAQSLYSLASTQKSLRNTARVQAGGWAATAACYGAKLFTGEAIANPVLFSLKLGGSIIMGTFYGYKQSYHNKRKKQVEAIADKLPQKGECNPVTGRPCFCAEPSSPESDPANYTKYCLPAEYAGRGPNATSCVTKTGAADPNCNCKASSSCITDYAREMGIKFKLGNTTTQGMINALSPLGNGYTAANFDQANDKQFAFAKKALNKLNENNNKLPSLNDEQKKLADMAAKLGIPAAVAAQLASQTSDSSGSMTASMKPEPSALKQSEKTAARASGYRKGNSIRKQSASNGSFSPFKNKKASAAGASIEVDNSYYKKAQAEAEIEKDASRPIFDIISLRYKQSAWRQLGSQKTD